MENIKYGIQTIFYLKNSARRDKYWLDLVEKYEDTLSDIYIKIGDHQLEFNSVEEAQIFCTDVLLAVTPINFFKKYLAPTYQRYIDNNAHDLDYVAAKQSELDKEESHSQCMSADGRRYEKLEFDVDGELLAHITYIIN